MFDKIYELAGKIEKGSTTDLDDRARACRATMEAVVEVNAKLTGVRTELSEAWRSGAGEMALADLDAFRMNREKQAEDFERAAQSFEVVRDALEKAQLEARSKRAEAKDLEAALDAAWKGAEGNPLKIPAAWAEQVKTKAQAALLLLDMERIVLSYDKVLNDEGATIRGMKGQIDEDAGAGPRAERDRAAGAIGYLSHIYDVAMKDPNRAKAMLMDKAMEDPELAAKIYELFGFKYDQDGDFYTTGEGSIQSELGWHNLYDELGGLIGAELHETGHPHHPEIAFTDSTGKNYRLELWKGSYGFGGSFGGEVGFYTRDPDTTGLPGWLAAAEGDDQIRVTQQIYEKGNPDHVYITNDGAGADGTDKRHFWNLAIQTDPDVGKDPNVDVRDQLGQRATIHVENPEVRDRMFEAMQRCAASDTSFEAHKNPDGSLSYTWD
jgi:hypothetical protein